MSSKYTTYLLGAGASAEVIPIYSFRNNNQNNNKTFSEDIILQLEEFSKSCRSYGNDGIRKKHRENNVKANPEIKELTQLYENLNLDIKWLKNELPKHKTIDTLAKRFTLLNEDQSLNKLKALISLYFLCKQIPDNYDKRYDSFYASILEKNESNNLSKINSKVKLPETIKIISWNYDYQFEIAFNNYCGYTGSEKRNLVSLQNDLKIFPSINLNNNKIDFSENVNIVKLNGTAAYFTDNEENIQPFAENISANNMDIDNIFKNLNNYKIASSSKKSNQVFNFAWDNNFITQHALKLAGNILSNTETLIIVGYSFPYFNREIDEKLFDSIDKSGIRKIIIQDKSPESIKQNILSRTKKLDSFLNNEKSNYITEYVDQFILPGDFRKNEPYSIKARVI